VLEPALVLLGIGFTSAVVLAVAVKVFYVEVDQRIADVEDQLPGANCGGCGYSGCAACAEAIVMNKAPVNACIAGGADTTAMVAEVMGVEAGFSEVQIARHNCTGGYRAHEKYEYDGLLDCNAMFELHGGNLICNTGCLGLGSCVKACDFNALHMGPDGYPEVDISMCVGCGACERICPTDVIKVWTQSQQLFHFNNEDECLSPCKQLCPAQIDIPGYVDLAAKGMFAESLDLIKQRNPLPLICGRVCPAPCEDGCRRVDIEDKAVHHNYIKRFVADWEMSLPEHVQPSILPDTDKKIAIIGGGPCGLSAAYYLRRFGHSPVIFDSKPELGGMMRYGIPEYRLPKKTLDYEINLILDLGVETRMNSHLGKNITIDELEKDYDAILFAMGAWDNTSLRCEGEDLEGVWKGTEFLEKRELGIDVDLKDKKVVVVGGGNTAMDACRSSLRQGAASVTLLYRRTRKEMPANAVEIVAAEHEGIIYQFLAAPTRILGDDQNKVTSIEYLKMELGEPDASGRRRPVPIPGSETVMEADVIISAIGQKPKIDWFTDDLSARGLKLTKWNTIAADEDTLQSDVPHIFTGGDLWSGPALLIDAVGTGRRAARSIHQFMNGEDLSFRKGTFVGPKRMGKSHQVPVHDVIAREMVAQPELPVDERITTFEEVDLVVTQEEMKVEADRCMRCGTLCYFTDSEASCRAEQPTKGEKLIRLLQESPK